MLFVCNRESSRNFSILITQHNFYHNQSVVCNYVVLESGVPYKRLAYCIAVVVLLGEDFFLIFCKLAFDLGFTN